MADNGEPGRALLLDTLLTDSDIHENLKTMLHDGLVVLNSDVALSWEPLLTAAVEILAIAGSLSSCGMTPGQKCVSVKFIPNSASKLPLTAVAASLEEPLRALWSRNGSTLATHLNGLYPKLSAEAVLQKAELVLSVCGLLNTLTFLVEGRYPTLWLRLLGVRQTPATRETFHQEDFSGVGREALWHTFRELVSVMLPFGQLVRTYALAHVVRRLRARRTSGVPSDGKRVLDFCALCGQSPPILPVVLPRSDCRHSFCYSCLKGEPLFSGGFVCPVCKMTVRSENAVFGCNGLPVP